MKKYDVKLIETYVFDFEVTAKKQSGSRSKSQGVYRQLRR